MSAAKIPFVDLKAQYRSIEPEIKEALNGVLERGDYILGAAVERFESEYAAFLGVKHAVGVSNGLDALRLALDALGVRPGDEVIVPSTTYIATALAATGIGAKVVLAEGDAGTFNLDPRALERAITARTKAIIPVHLGGQAANLKAILEIAHAKKIPVVEDAAQSHGSTYEGKMTGSLGAAGCFSFYPGKNLGAYGDAGLVATNDAALAERMRRLRNYGQRVKYEHVEKGLNLRLDSMQAAILSVKLKRLKAWNEARVTRSARYLKALSGVGDLRFQKPEPGATHVYHLFMIETDHRDRLQAHLKEAGVETNIHYPTPIHLQGAYSDLGLREGSFPVAEARARRTLSLPMFAELTDAQVDAVCAAVKSFFARVAAS